MPNYPKRKRERWFQLGVDAFQCISDGFPVGYVCPLCLRLFPREALDAGLLTLEHVPPENVGGKELVLTCAECNHKASNLLDRQAKLVEQRHRFDDGTLDEPMLVKLTIGDVTAHAKITSTGQGKQFELGPEPRANQPGAKDAMTEAIRQELLTGDSATLTYTVDFRDDYDEPRARISWLRSAYLVAFAMFGYAYAINPSLRPVIDQIAHPDADILKIVNVGGGSDPISVRRVAEITTPQRLRSIAVQFGRQVVFVPAPWSGNDIYASLVEDAVAGRTFRESGTGYAWPRYPMHVIDRMRDYTGVKLIVRQASAG